MIDRDRIPTERELRVFTALLPAFFAIVGALRWSAGGTGSATLLWVVGAAMTIVAIASTRARRSIHRGWMLAAHPIGWVVSHTILLAIYLVVATPIALVLRLVGRDPMQRGFDRSAPTYWQVRDARVARGARYFRQF